jgi:hypothetical protein
LEESFFEWAIPKFAPTGSGATLVNDPRTFHSGRQTTFVLEKLTSLKIGVLPGVP